VDRIRKALDLAREERARNQEMPALATLAQVQLGAEPPVAPPDRQVIHYTHTAVFKTDPAVLEENRILNPASDADAAFAFRMLRTQVLQRMDHHGWRSLAVLSAGESEGKTTTAANLAIALGNDRQHTVLLVDADLKNPRIGATFGLSVTTGIDHVLRGEADVADCLHHPEGFERLVLLPAHGALEHSSEALAGPEGRALTAGLKGRYPERIIIFDLPPVLRADDALAFLPQVDCCLLVIAEGITGRDELVRCMELLRNTPIVGTVLNKASAGIPGYGR
jgi:Mrp family chromosome partitioning ATPase